MNAPAPASAGPRPATAPRADAPRAEGPDRDARRKERTDAGHDFSAVLSGRSAKRAKNAASSVVVVDPAGATPAQDPAPATLVPAAGAVVPAALALGAEAEPVDEPTAVTSEVEKKSQVALVDLAPGQPAEDPEPTDAAVRPSVRSATPSVESKPLAVAAGRDAEDGTPVVTDPQVVHRGPVPSFAHPPVEAAAPEPPAPAAVDAGGSSVAFQPSDPPAWRLAIDQPAPVRTEAPVAGPQPLPVQPQAVIGQIAIAVGKAADRKVEIRLDPPELGRVQIHLTPVDGGLQAVVLADRPETQNLLRRHADMLARDLGAAGYDSVSLDFASGGQAEPGRQETRVVDWGQASLAAAAAESVPLSPRRVSAGGLDVRL